MSFDTPFNSLKGQTIFYHSFRYIDCQHSSGPDDLSPSFFQVMTSFGGPLVQKLGIEGNALDRMKVVEDFITKEMENYSPKVGGNYIEQHKEKTVKAQPGSR